jgi:hypothetical protein
MDDTDGWLAKLLIFSFHFSFTALLLSWEVCLPARSLLSVLLDWPWYQLGLETGDLSLFDPSGELHTRPTDILIDSLSLRDMVGLGWFRSAFASLSLLPRVSTVRSTQFAIREARILRRAC